MTPLQLSVLIFAILMIGSFWIAINRQDRFGDWLMTMVFVPSTIALVVLLFLGLIANN